MKRAIVIGASSGIGREVAKLLLQQGWTLGVAARRVGFTDIRPGFVDTALLSGDFHYPMMLRPERVAREIVSAINRRQHIRVIDWRYRLLTALWRRIPRFIWRHIKL